MAFENKKMWKYRDRETEYFSIKILYKYLFVVGLQYLSQYDICF
jgi:hypothetical protein